MSSFVLMLSKTIRVNLPFSFFEVFNDIMLRDQFNHIKLFLIISIFFVHLPPLMSILRNGSIILNQKRNPPFPINKSDCTFSLIGALFDGMQKN